MLAVGLHQRPTSKLSLAAMKRGSVVIMWQICLCLANIKKHFLKSSSELSSQTNHRTIVSETVTQSWRRSVWRNIPIGELLALVIFETRLEEKRLVEPTDAVKDEVCLQPRTTLENLS